MNDIDLTARLTRGLLHTLQVYDCLRGLTPEQLRLLEERIMTALCQFQQIIEEDARHEYLQIMPSHLFQQADWLVQGSEN